MSTPRSPQRLPEEIYRRRRIAALVILAVVVLLIGWGVSALVGGDSSEKSTDASPSETSANEVTSTETASSEATTSKKPQESSGPCTSQMLAISAASSRPTVTVGADVQLVMTVKNTSRRACTAQVGAAAQRYEVYTLAGNEKVWSNVACGAPKGDEERVLQPGETANFSVTWRRAQRNVSGDECQPDGPAAEPGAYQVYAVLASVPGEPGTFNIAAERTPGNGAGGGQTTETSDVVPGGPEVAD